MRRVVQLDFRESHAGADVYSRQPLLSHPARRITLWIRRRVSAAAGFGGRRASALPPPWPMGRIVSEGRVSGALAARGWRSDPEQRLG